MTIPYCTCFFCDKERTKRLFGNHLCNQDFIDSLLATKSGDEWSVLVKGMLAKNGGEYPPDWFEKVMASGVTAQCEKNWGDAVSSSYKIPAPNVNVPPGER